MEAKFCARCGKELGTDMRFCPGCGAATAPRTTPSVDEMQLPALTPPAIAFFCYFVPIAAAVFFLNMRQYQEDRETRFHAWQSVYFFGAWIGLHIVVGILSLPFMVLHLPFHLLLWPMLNFVLGLVWIYLLMQALSGKRVSLPVIGELAASKAFGGP